MSGYRELAPPPPLIDTVECFWVFGQDPRSRAFHRVVPDGCADIIYTRAGAFTSLQFIAPMTRYQDFPQTPGSCSVGVRCRPAMWAAMLRLNGSELTDRTLPFEDLWGTRARELQRRLDSYQEPAEVTGELARSLPPSQARSPFQKAIAALEQSGGLLSIDDAASAAGLSTRQFRRRCLESTSLSPKLLARILRFRRANDRAAAMVNRHADLAVDCGYADQSHWIAECRRFTGKTSCSLLTTDEV